jgi:hypothetical protein
MDPSISLLSIVLTVDPPMPLPNIMTIMALLPKKSMLLGTGFLMMV